MNATCALVNQMAKLLARTNPAVAHTMAELIQLTPGLDTHSITQRAAHANVIRMDK